MKKLILVLLFFAFAKNAASQNEKDSLIQLLKNHPQHDTLRCFYLVYLIDYENDPEVWNTYNNELEKISLEGISKSKPQSPAYIGFLSALSRAYNNKSAYFGLKNDDMLAFDYIRKAYRICLALNDDGGSGLACHNIALKYENRGLIDSAIIFYKKAIHHYSKNHDNEQVAMVISDMGDTYRVLGDLKSAIEMNLKALKIFEETKNQVGIERSCFAIGKIFHTQNEYDKAIDYFNRALEINIRQQNNEKRNKLLISIAQVYMDNRQFEKAYQSIKQALEFDIKSDQERNFIADYKTLGSYYYEISQIDSAIKYLEKSLFYAQKTDLKSNYSSIYIDLANSYKKINDKVNQRKNAELALKYSRESSQSVNMYQAAEMLAGLYKEAGDYVMLSNMLEIVLEHKNKLFNDETKNIAIKKEFEFTAQKKQAEIAQLEQQNQIATLQAKQRSIILYSIIGLVMALALLSYFLFTRYKAKKQNELLTQKLADAELLRETEHKASQSEIKAIKSQMNPHFFYNALNSIQGFIYTGDKEKAAESIGLFSDLSRFVLESSRNNEISLHDEISLLENYLKLETMRLPKIAYHIEVDQSIQQHDVYLPSMILQPLVENAIKHGLANKSGPGTIGVRFTKDNDNLFIEMEDDGIGRKAAGEINKRFQKRTASFSTEANINRIELLNENKTGKITQEIIDKFDDENNPAGTLVKISIPIRNYD